MHGTSFLYFLILFSVLNVAGGLVSKFSRFEDKLEQSPFPNVSEGGTDHLFSQNTNSTGTDLTAKKNEILTFESIPGANLTATRRNVLNFHSTRGSTLIHTHQPTYVYAPGPAPAYVPMPGYMPASTYYQQASTGVPTPAYTIWPTNMPAPMYMYMPSPASGYAPMPMPAPVYQMPVSTPALVSPRSLRAYTLNSVPTHDKEFQFQWPATTNIHSPFSWSQQYVPNQGQILRQMPGQQPKQIRHLRKQQPSAKRDDSGWFPRRTPGQDETRPWWWVMWQDSPDAEDYTTAAVQSHNTTKQINDGFTKKAETAFERNSTLEPLDPPEPYDPSQAAVDPKERSWAKVMNDPIRELDEQYFKKSYNTSEWMELAPKPYNEMEWVRETPEPMAWMNRFATGESNFCIDDYFVPEFYVLGSMMSGTTSLCAKLRRSPATLWAMAHDTQAKQKTTSKESHFFDLISCASCNMINVNSVKFSEFGRCQKSTRQVPIDGTSRYLTDPDIPHAMLQFYGNYMNRVKFLILLREPLQRTQSHYYHSKLYGWCPDHSQQTFKEVVDSILKGDDAKWLGSTNNPRGAGCGDFLESSLYLKQLERWFKEFSSSQFIVMPFQYNTEPGKDGRPNNRDMVEDLWKRLGVHGLVGEQIHANEFVHPPLWDDLDPIKIADMYRYFEPKTGPLKLATLFSSSQANLYHYVGTLQDVDKIASWLRKNW